MEFYKKKNRNTVLGSSGKGGLLNYVGVLIFITVWWLLSWTGLVNRLLLPTPLRVIEAIYDVGWVLFLHFSATFLRICLGFFIGCFAGLFTGFLMQYKRSIYVTLDGLIETIRPIPPVAIVPFFILIFGFSEIGKILIAVIGVWVLITVTTVEAIERVPVGIIRWGLVKGLRRHQLFQLVIIPAAWPEMRGGFRISMALTITLIVVAEFMGAKYGLGYLLSVSKVTLTTPTILLCIILLGWLGWFLDRSLRIFFEKTTDWDIRAKGATI